MERVLIESGGGYLRPEDLAEPLHSRPGTLLLQTASFDSPSARYSILGSDPFLVFQSHGSRCETRSETSSRVSYGDPWRLLEELCSRYEILDDADVPYPLGAAMGYWGYELRRFVEPRLTRRPLGDPGLPDCWVGFYDSLAVFDHHLRRVWLISTGMQPDGSRSAERAARRLDLWKQRCAHAREEELHGKPAARTETGPGGRLSSNLDRTAYQDLVRAAIERIRQGEIYQVNLAQQLAVEPGVPAWPLYRRLLDLSPTPFAAWVNCDDLALASASPELFLRMSGAQVVTRPIKGTRPRGLDADRDARLAYELQTSAKESAELVMITDLLRNDLGRICEFGSVRVPELMRLERFAQVQHLVSTVEGRLRPGLSHLEALAACFPGGSVTGAPKFRAMEIIDQLEPDPRGPYTGCAGYLGFNRESALSILIRTAVCRRDVTWFHAGAGIVADSLPDQEYEETLAKAAGFLAAAAPWIGNEPGPAAWRSGRRGTTQPEKNLQE